MMLYRAENGSLLGSDGDAVFVPVDSIMPAASIMDIDLADPCGCLFFSVCF